MTKPPLPKKRNATKTKAKILNAAKECFAELGYSHAGIRAIAERADVSSTLLLRYFGSKKGLFEAALIDAMQAGELYKVERERFGEYLSVTLKNRELDIKPPSMISLSIGNVEAREIITQVIEENALKPLAKWLGPPDAEARAMKIHILVMSYYQYTQQIPLLASNSKVSKSLSKWFAESVQAIVDS